MVRFYSVLTVFLALCLGCCMVSCNDEPEFSEIIEERIGVDDGVILKNRNQNILTLTSDYPLLLVSSVFGLTVVPPEIAYLGQFCSLEEIPVSTSERFSTVAPIHNGGGYLIKTSLLVSSTNETEPCIIRLLVNESDEVDENGLPQELIVKYQFYR